MANRRSSFRPKKPLYPLVSFKKGWVLCALGLLVSFILAVFIRTVFSPTQMRQWIQNEIFKSHLPIQVDFSEVSIDFSQGALPWLGLVIKDLSILKIENSASRCHTPVEFRARELRVPLSITYLLQNRLNFSQIYFSHGQIRYVPQICQETSSDKKEDETKVYREEGGDSKIKWGLSLKRLTDWHDLYVKFMNDWGKSSGSRVQLVFFDQLDLVEEREDKRKISLQNLLIQHLPSLLPNEWSVQSKIFFSLNHSSDLDSSSLFVVGPLFLKGTLYNSQIDFDLYGNYKEGNLLGKLQLNWKDLSTQLFLETQQLPLHPILHFLKEQTSILSNFHTKYFWLNCRIKYEGKILDLDHHPFKLESCGIKGDVGQAELHHVQWYPWRQPSFDQFEIEIKDLDVQKMVLALKKMGPTGVLSRFGLLNGRLYIDQWDQMKFVGEIRDLEMAFSNFGNRGKQWVKSLKGELSINRDLISGDIFSMDLEEGAFKGKASFQYNLENLVGTLTIGIDQLRLHPSIQRLLLGGEIGLLSIHGSGKISDKLLSYWKGSAEIHDVKGNKWSVDHVRSMLEFTSEKLIAKSKGFQVKIEENSHFYPLFETLFVEDNHRRKDQKNKDAILFSKFEGQLIVHRNNGIWDKFSIFEAKNIHIRTSGEWNEDRQLNGEILLDFPQGKKSKWKLGGTINQMEVQSH